MHLFVRPCSFDSSETSDLVDRKLEHIVIHLVELHDGLGTLQVYAPTLLACRTPSNGVDCALLRYAGLYANRTRMMQMCTDLRTMLACLLACVRACSTYVIRLVQYCVSRVAVTISVVKHHMWLGTHGVHDMSITVVQMCVYDTQVQLSCNVT